MRTIAQTGNLLQPPAFFQVPASRESLATAIEVSNREKVEARAHGISPTVTAFHLPLDEREEILARKASIALLAEMVDTYGLVTVQQWLRLTANLRGKDLV